MSRTLHFIKMDGTGNDFVIIDAREQDTEGLNKAIIRDACDRGNSLTKGADQFIVMERSTRADCFMRIFNADGSQVDACGNATRCVAWLLRHYNKGEDEFFEAASMSTEAHKTHDKVVVETNAGLLHADITDASKVMVDMGMPGISWQEIPLAKEMDTLRLPLEEGPLKEPVAVSMGNPHVVFFTGNIEAIPLEVLGPKLEVHPFFPKKANISIASIDNNDIHLKVWERGAGLTQSCGTAACATFVAARRRGYLKGEGDSARVHLPGGSLFLMWARHNDHVLMQGPVRLQFEGELNI